MTPGMNLLPTSHRIRQSALTTIRRWIGILIVVVMLTCVWGIKDVLRSQESRGTMQQLRSQAEPIRLQQTESGRLRGQYDQLRKQETLEGELAERPSLTDLMGIIVRASKHCNGTVGIRTFDLSQKNRDNGRTSYSLAILGIGTDDLSIAHFAAALRDSVAFTRVQLISTAPISENEISARSFSLECTY
jgi:hypothetical protein